MNKVVTILIFRVTTLFSEQTLLTKCWKNIKKSAPEIYRMRRERRFDNLKEVV